MLAKLLNRPLWTPWIVILALLIANFTIATLFGNLTELPPRSWQTWSVVAIVGSSGLARLSDGLLSVPPMVTCTRTSGRLVPRPACLTVCTARMSSVGLRSGVPKTW